MTGASRALRSIVGHESTLDGSHPARELPNCIPEGHAVIDLFTYELSFGERADDLFQRAVLDAEIVARGDLVSEAALEVVGSES
jgi:hypothetical protein